LWSGCRIFNIHLSWSLGSSLEWARWDNSKHKVERNVEWGLLFL
jgi:hypothetical protein